jgi:hypothetical protein
MSKLDSVPGLIQALQGEMTPKFLASRSPEGQPNVVPLVSILPADDQEDTLFFGNFLLRKTVKNLDLDPRVGILVITPDLKGWILTGDFIEWQKTGKYVEKQMNSSLLRYNAYTGIRNAGIIHVRDVLGGFKISKLQVAFDFFWTRFSNCKVSHIPDPAITIPHPVQVEFNRMVAVKVLAWIAEDGYPRIIPVLSLQPTGDRGLAGRVKPYGQHLPPANDKVAVNILTFEAISYQVKGTWAQDGSLGVIRAQEIYAGGPPKPGGRII